MKDKIRAIGIDDAPFEFKDDRVLVVGSLIRATNYIEGVLSKKVKVDGGDSTEKIIKMLNGRLGEQARVLFIDGLALGGFNVIDIERLSEDTGKPVITISREKPDFRSIKDAMKKHLDNWKEKFDLMDKDQIYEVETEHKPIFIQIEGLDLDQAKHYVHLFTIRGRIPEPIRISHIIASGIKRGESKGKA